MKKSYKLYGYIWDGIIPCDSFKVCNDNYISYLDEPDNIFDIVYSGKKVRLSKLLEINDKYDIDNIINKIFHYKNIIIDVDVSFVNDNIVLKKFLFKRICQIYVYMENELSYSNIYLSLNKEVEFLVLYWYK